MVNSVSAPHYKLGRIVVKTPQIVAFCNAHNTQGDGLAIYRWSRSSVVCGGSYRRYICNQLAKPDCRNNSNRINARGGRGAGQLRKVYIAH